MAVGDAGNEQLRLEGGGDHAAQDETGDDGLYFSATLTAADRVDGRGGADDQLGFQGDFNGANALRRGADQLAGIDTIVLLTGLDTRFGGNGAGFSCFLTTSDGDFEGGVLTINGDTLRAGETLSFDGGQEDDVSFRIFSGMGADFLVGGRRGDEIFAGAGDDDVAAGAGNDSVNGGEGDDNLFGGVGNDMIRGGLGADRLDGGEGDDFFVYASVAESTAAARDAIDVASGDRIDLSTIDARAGTPENDAFRFIGSSAFTGAARELRIAADGAGFLIEGDVDGDGLRDLVIFVDTANDLPPPRPTSSSDAPNARNPSAMTSIETGADPLLTRRGGLIEAEVDGELVALHEENGTCYGFNGTATRIWGLLGEPRRLSSLHAALSAEFDIDSDTLAQDVDALLGELEADGLIARTAG